MTFKEELEKLGKPERERWLITEAFNQGLDLAKARKYATMPPWEAIQVAISGLKVSEQVQTLTEELDRARGNGLADLKAQLQRAKVEAQECQDAFDQAKEDIQHEVDEYIYDPIDRCMPFESEDYREIFTRRRKVIERMSQLNAEIRELEG